MPVLWLWRFVPPIQVARLKAREVELNQRQRNRHENMEAVAADIPDILTVMSPIISNKKEY